MLDLIDGQLFANRLYRDRPSPLARDEPRFLHRSELAFYPILAGLGDVEQGFEADACILAQRSRQFL